MTTIDDRGRAAARALREAIAARLDDVPLHDIDDEPPRRRRSHVLVAAAVVVVLAGAVVAVALAGRDGPDRVAARKYLARTITVQRGARQVALAPDGVWVLGGCAAPSEAGCNELRRAGAPPNEAQRLPQGVDRALTYASGSLWAVGGGDRALPTGTVVRLGPDGRAQHTFRFADMTPTEVVGAYDAVWVLDVQRERVLRIDPATNATEFFDLRTRSLGRVQPQQMLVADNTIVLSTRCCGADPQYAQVGRVDRNGTFTTFFSTAGHLAVATDGTNLWVNTPTGPTHKFAISRANRDAVSWYSLLDEDYRLQPGVKVATHRSVWSVRAAAGTVQRFDRPKRQIEQPFALPRGGFDDTELDVARTTSRAWVLDGAHGVLYELRDPNE